MANAENLKGKGLDSRTANEQREIARKGGQASGAARRLKKMRRVVGEILLDMPVEDRELQRTMERMGVPEEERTYRMGVVVAMLNQAMKGTATLRVLSVIPSGKARATSSGGRSWSCPKPSSSMRRPGPSGRRRPLLRLSRRPTRPAWSGRGWTLPGMLTAVIRRRRGLDGALCRLPACPLPCRYGDL